MTQQPHEAPQAALPDDLADLLSDAAESAIADVRALGISESQLSDADIIDLLSESITAKIEDQ